MNPTPEKTSSNPPRAGPQAAQDFARLLEAEGKIG